MTWLTPFVVATLASTIVLALVYVYLYLQERERYLGIWSANWGMFALRLFFQLWGLVSGETLPLTLAEQTVAFASSFFLLWGTHVMTGRRMPRWWAAVCLAGMLWIFLAGPTVSYAILTLPLFLFQGAVYLWTGWVILRMEKLAGLGKYLAGWAFIVWGLHKLDFPILSRAPAVAPWGFLFSSLLELIVAVGILLIHFQLNREALRRREAHLKKAQAALKRKTRQQERLIEAARQLTESLDLDAVLHQIGQGAKEILEAYTCAIYLLEADNRTLAPTVVIDPDYREQTLANPLDIDCSFTGQAVKARCGLIFNDSAANPAGYLLPGTPLIEEERIIAAPLIDDGRALGAICLSRLGDSFTGEDLAMVETFAAYASVALKNAQAHDKLQREVAERRRAEALLEERNRELGESQERFQKAFHTSPDLIAITRLEDGVLVDANNNLTTMTGYTREETISRSTLGLSIWTDSRDRTRLVKQLKKDGRVENLEAGIRCKDGRIETFLLSATMIQLNDDPHILISARSIEERIQAEQRLKKKTHHQQHLIETARHLTESLNLKQVLKRIAAGAREILEATGCVLYFLEADGRTLTPVIAVEPAYEDEILATSLDIDDSLTGQCVKAARGLIFNQIGPETGGKQIPGTPEISQECVIVAPFILDDRVLGAMCLNRVDAAFMEEDLALAETFAAYASVSLKNAQAHDELKREVEERRRAEEALRASEERYRSLFESNQSVMLLIDPDNGDILDANQAACKYFRVDKQNLVGNKMVQINSLSEEEVFQEMQRARQENREHLHFQHRLADGQARYVDVYSGPIKLDGKDVLFCIVHDVTERVQREREMETIVSLATALRSANSRAEMPPVIIDQVVDLLDADGAALVLHDSLIGENVFEMATGTAESLKGRHFSTDQGICGFVISTGQTYLNNDVRSEPRNISSFDNFHPTALAAVPLIARDEVLGSLLMSRNTPFNHGDLRLLTAIADIAASAIQRQTLTEQTLQHARNMGAVSTIGRFLAETLDAAQIYRRLAGSVNDLLPDIATIFISRFDPERDCICAVFGQQDGQLVDVSILPPLPLAPDGRGTQSQVIHSRSPLVVSQLPETLQVKHLVGETEEVTQSALFVPLLAKGEILGVLQVQSYRPNRFTQTDAELLMIVGNTAAVAMKNAELFEETRRRLQQLNALYAIDKAITTNFDLGLTLQVVLDQTIAQLGVDAVAIYLLKTTTQTLDCVTSRGFSPGVSLPAMVRVGDGLAGRVAQERRMLVNRDWRIESGESRLDQTPTNNYSSLSTLHRDGFVAYFGVPLIAKGQVKGVLEMYHRSPLDPDPEWLSFLDTLARQTAIAVDNTDLFRELQRSYQEISDAYDTTLGGWARALELRDKETEGHSQRVTELAVALGEAMGMSAEELVHLRRGALLHDIGKMGIPDTILGKTGLLKDEEWEIMQQHPGFAYNLLAEIPFLQPALDIPYCHHEKWDGSGYPRGLQGEEIPLAARIFAVVDVWDALRSNRPYRAPWPEEKARAYLQEQAGVHFDPEVLKVFFGILET